MAAMIAGILLALGAAIILVDMINTYYIHFVPAGFSKFIYAAIVAFFVYIIIKIVTRYLEKFLLRFMDISRVHPIKFVVSILGYFVLALAVFSTLGLNVSSIVLGSTFISLILGLAAQSVLANMFAGFLLISAKPFKVGDRVAVLAWQYGIALPSYPPKFFSKDEIRPSYNGTVVTITINYTTIEENSGNLVRIPNSVMLGASISIPGKILWVKTRYEVPKTIPFSSIQEGITTGISKIKGSVGMPSVSIDETTMTTYIIAVLGKFRTDNTDVLRGQMLEFMMNYIEPMKSPQK